MMKTHLIHARNNTSKHQLETLTQDNDQMMTEGLNI